MHCKDVSLEVGFTQAVQFELFFVASLSLSLSRTVSLSVHVAFLHGDRCPLVLHPSTGRRLACAWQLSSWCSSLSLARSALAPCPILCKACEEGPALNVLLNLVV